MFTVLYFNLYFYLPLLELWWFINVVDVCAAVRPVCNNKDQRTDLLPRFFSCGNSKKKGL